MREKNESIKETKKAREMTNKNMRERKVLKCKYTRERRRLQKKIVKIEIKIWTANNSREGKCGEH